MKSIISCCLNMSITLHTEGDIFVLCQAGNVWIEYTIPVQIRSYTAVFYGVLHRISPTTFHLLKIQLETARFETRTFRVPVYRATNWAVLTGSIKFKITKKRVQHTPLVNSWFLYIQWSIFPHNISINLALPPPPN